MIGNCTGDGDVKEKGLTKTALSRTLVVEVALKDPWCGMTQVAVCNQHLHFMMANTAQGFTQSHNHFWGEVCRTIMDHKLRILAGDSNMSLWIVAREMRKRGLQISLAAAFAWNDPLAQAVRSDSCGRFSLVP